MPDQDIQDDLAAHVGGATFPKTRRDYELVGEGKARRSIVCVSMTVQAADAAEAHGFNGRETAGYVLGYWQRHYGAAVDAGYDFTSEDARSFELLATIRRDHLPAVSATLLSAGACVELWHDSGTGRPSDCCTVRLSFRP